MLKPKALGTGGCGFVGRHFVKALLQDGYRVTIVDDLSTGLPLDKWPLKTNLSDDLRADVTTYICDFRDYAKAEATDNFDLIIHLAAIVGGRMTIEGDPLSVATDLSIDATFFNWVVKQRPLPRQVIYFSSSAAYPIKIQTSTHHEPLDENLIDFDTRLELPDMTYGWSKLTGEYLAKHAAETYGLNTVIYRPFSGYGEEQDFTYPFPSIIRRVARHESPIVVWGSGNQLRDFIHIDDVVQATFASRGKLAPGEALNLGSGVGISFRQFAELACNVIGHHAEIVNDASKPEGVFARVANSDMMFQHYRPKISLEQGIRRVFKYQCACGLVNEGERR
jgi:GDP-L-fucose synthase